MKTTPFRIDVPQSTLDDLKRRLTATRWPEQPEGAGWGLGTDLGFMRLMTERWLNHYDWRVQEAALNAHPQFKADVDGTEIHFVHVRGKGKNPTPLLLIHAFPDSFYRFHKVIPLLTDPGAHGLDPNLSFDVVVPSLPGFGFSGSTPMAVDPTADKLARLMEGLGYDSYV
jgi:hypothetical protein